MTPPRFRRVTAVHPDWSGYLLLSTVDNAIVHEGFGSQGTYDLRDRVLSVRWERFGDEAFSEVAGVFVQTRAAGLIPRAEQLRAISVNGKPAIAQRVSVLVPDTTYEVTLRLDTTDIPTFDQIFVRNEYRSRALPASADVIVDLGANIGLATVFFAMAYPRARILAVEPERRNYQALAANTAALGERVVTRQAAVWVNDGFVDLRTRDDRGAPLGAWGVQVSEQSGASDHSARCFTLNTLLDEAGFATVDVLKVDIEGAEREVFARGADAWLPRVRLIVVETHDWFRPGSEAAVRRAVQPLFEELPRSGENLIFRRRSV